MQITWVDYRWVDLQTGWFNKLTIVTLPAGMVAKYYQFFCACCLWPWLGPPLAGWRNPKMKGQFWGFSSPLTMHCNAFVAEGIIRSPVTSGSRGGSFHRCHICCKWDRPGRGWWEYTARAKYSHVWIGMRVVWPVTNGFVFVCWLLGIRWHACDMSVDCICIFSLH